MSFEYFIGRRYLKAKQQQTFISLITILSIAGVTVGVMALIVVIAVMAGFESDLKSRILGVESHVVVMHQGEDFVDYRHALEQIKTIADVEDVTPFIYAQVMLRSPSGVAGSVLRGIDPATVGRVIQNFDPTALRRLEATAQTEETIRPVPGIILGRELARNLGLTVGERLYLISPRGMLSPVGHIPSMRQFEVVGIFKSGMYEFDGSLAYVHLREARKILRMPDAVTGIEVRIRDIYDVKQIALDITRKLGAPYWTKDWMQMNQNLFSALKLEKTVMFIILALIILVAAFNIASTLIMMVMEKTRDIAILKAMGASDGSIRKIFVFKGMVIGAVGTLLGVALGFVLCVLLEKYKFIELPGDVYYITTLPVRLEAVNVVITAVAAMVICFVATLYPARQASRLNPIEAIRYG